MIKVGIEGKEEEIRNFLVNYGTGSDDIIKKPIKIHFIVIPTIFLIFIAICLVFWMKVNLPFAIYGLLFIFGLISILCITICIHLIFKSYFVSALCAFFLLIIFSVCLGFLGLDEAMKTLRDNIHLKVP